MMELVAVGHILTEVLRRGLSVFIKRALEGSLRMGDLALEQALRPQGQMVLLEGVLLEQGELGHHL